MAAMATKVKRSFQRVSSATSLWMFWTVRKPISGSSRKKVMTAVRAASFAAAARSMRASPAAPCACMSDFLDVRPAEQALWQEDEGDGEHREGRDVLVVDREVGRPHGLDQADENPADHCARQRADAAEHRGGECFDTRHKIGRAHV